MGFNIWSLLIILLIVLLLFGTKKLRNMGGDVGGAIRGFKDAMKEGESGKDEEQGEQQHGEDSGEQLEHRASSSEEEATKTNKVEQEAETAPNRDRNAS